MPDSSVTIHPPGGIAGTPPLPADKSVAHRALILSALAEGESEIVNVSDAADPASTRACLEALGVHITKRDGSLFVQGKGLRGLRPPDGPLDCGNSGTTMRLLSGVLAGQRFASTLTGDASLSARPMNRIAEPLREMGASITLTESHAPIEIDGGGLEAIRYRLPVASAQVKSCVLLAGLFATGETTVVEPTPSRDHTERMLGLSVMHMGRERHLSVTGGQAVPAGLRVVPGDLSAAAFFLGAAAVIPNASLEMTQVGVNPTRGAVIDVLRAMGAVVLTVNHRERGGEPIADLRAFAPPDGLHGVEVGGDIVPNLIDEIPIVAVVATAAEGRTLIRDAAELRVKETDRLAAIAAVLEAMGANIEETDDGLIIEGRTPLTGAEVDARGDHRIAMAAAVAALSANGPSTIHGASSVGVSFPGFWDALRAIAGDSVVEMG